MNSKDKLRHEIADIQYEIELNKQSLREKEIRQQAENKKELEYLMRFESWASRLAEYSQDMEEPQ